MTKGADTSRVKRTNTRLKQKYIFIAIIPSTKQQSGETKFQKKLTSTMAAKTLYIAE